MPHNKPHQITGRKTIWEGKFIRSILLEYMDDKGHVRFWEAVERINCSGIVAIIPITADGQLLMIRQFRPSLNCHVIEFPAGLNDKGESLENAAKRELIEETSYTSESLEWVAEGPISSGLSTEILTVFVAKDAVPASAELIAQFPIDETEDIEVIKVPLSEAYDRLEEYRKKGDLADVKIYGFIELARKRIGK